MFRDVICVECIFSEELHGTEECPKSIMVSDRATLFNLLTGLNGYTISSGILSSDLNGDCSGETGNPGTDGDRVYPSYGQAVRKNGGTVFGTSERFISRYDFDIT